MAIDIFMKIEGFEGESVSSSRAGWIEVRSFAWGGATNGAPGIPGKASFSDMTIAKTVDRTSPLAALALATGRVFDEVVIEIARAGGSQGLITRMILSDCFVSGINQTADTDSGSLVENLSLSYSGIEWQYHVTDSHGNDAGEIKTSFILRTNEAVTAFEQGIDCLPSFRGRESDSMAMVNRFVDGTAFIIMWMDPDVPELDDVHQGIKDVCAEYSINAIRADGIEHDDVITDAVMEKIRLSQFIIADLTGERPNVYYEIGFAHAIGKRPILLRREGSKLHFDLAVHNVRPYRNIKDLKDTLRSRLGVLCNRGDAG